MVRFASRKQPNNRRRIRYAVINEHCWYLLLFLQLQSIIPSFLLPVTALRHMHGRVVVIATRRR